MLVRSPSWGGATRIPQHRRWRNRGSVVPLTTKNIITPRWQDLEDFNSHWMMLVGRLKPGVSRAQAEASLQPLWHALRTAELAKDSQRLRTASPHLSR